MIDFRQNEFSGDLSYEKQRIIRKKDWGILLIVGLIVTGIVTGITYSGTFPMAVGCIFANKLFHFIFQNTIWTDVMRNSYLIFRSQTEDTRTAE